MKRWPLIVVGLYLAALIVLTWPVVYGAFVGGEDGADPLDTFGVFGSWPYWAYLGIMGLAQLALLAVPVQAAHNRPIARRPLIFTVLASGLMMGGLLVGVLFSVIEFIAHFDSEASSLDAPEWSVTAALILGGLMWVAWTVVFYMVSRRKEPRDVIARQCRYLFRGSILELLVAVPLHVVARRRGYCCAGFMTFVGIAMGIAVMLFAYGPAIYFLFVARWRRLHPQEEPLRSVEE